MTMFSPKFGVGYELLRSGFDPNAQERQSLKRKALDEVRGMFALASRRRKCDTSAPVKPETKGK